MNAAAAVAHNSVGDTSASNIALKKRSNNDKSHLYPGAGDERVISVSNRWIRPPGPVSAAKSPSLRPGEHEPFENCRKLFREVPCPCRRFQPSR